MHRNIISLYLVACILFIAISSAHALGQNKHLPRLSARRYENSDTSYDNNYYPYRYRSYERNRRPTENTYDSSRYRLSRPSPYRKSTSSRPSINYDQTFNDQIFDDKVFSDKTYDDQMSSEKESSSDNRPVIIVMPPQMPSSQMYPSQMYPPQMYSPQFYPPQMYPPQTSASQAPSPPQKPVVEQPTNQKPAEIIYMDKLKPFDPEKEDHEAEEREEN